MPVPSSYTEKTLAEYMYAVIGKVAPVLNVHLSPTDAGDLKEPVVEALLVYGVENIADISGLDSIKKLRAVARVAVWQYVVANFTALYDFSADGSSYNRSQMYKNAKDSLAIAESQLLQYDANYSARVISVRYLDDPYTYSADELGE